MVLALKLDVTHDPRHLGMSCDLGQPTDLTLMRTLDCVNPSPVRCRA
jgi:hypothetical protein